ncbi:MAG: hypothetical protein WC861_03210 [Candidatus Micrarchaeia archaeon]|jgi:hypothetical protein
MRLVVLAFAAVLLFSVFGCAGNGQAPSQQAANLPQAVPSGAAGSTASPGAQAGGAGGSAEPEFAEWNAPDGSITLQVPKGWTATEKQVDACTVSWAARDSAGTGTAFMNNQVMVLKSEGARQMYKAYGLAGVDSAPVAGYLPPEQALLQVVAPLSGATGVQVMSRDAALGEQLAKGLCIAGIAACEAGAFDAAFDYKGVRMHGRYFLQTHDFGEGTTWWINLWGYEAPEADWEKTSPIAGKIFASANYTEGWASKCGKGTGAAGVIGDVVKSRQAASEKAAEEWDAYIRGG